MINSHVKTFLKLYRIGDGNKKKKNHTRSTRSVCVVSSPCLTLWCEWGKKHFKATVLSFIAQLLNFNE